MREGRREFGRVVVVVLCAAALSGCAIERPGLTASSANPSPWFNFQLAPKKKDTTNYQRGIARSATDRVTVQPAMAPVQKEVRWPELPLPLRKREAQLIPRTNDQAGSSKPPAEVAFAAESFDFN
ncbi:MAG TPA: hypothetical protein VFG20_02795 [Planctomycetaceae bacterium]|nr:hypothetical protein [Planctomycetaceae bacterium]